MHTNGSPPPYPATSTNRVRVVLVENNPLTVWAIKRTLVLDYELLCFATLDEARAELERPGLAVVICGSPIVDENPDALQHIARSTDRKVIALVSNPDFRVPAGVRVLEKPFDLADLAKLLAKDLPGTQNPRTAQQVLRDRLDQRFRDEICRVCVHRMASGRCALAQHVDCLECPVFHWAEPLAKLVASMESDRLGDYLDQIQSIICPQCKQTPNGQCQARNGLDCPLDLYLGLVVPIIEDELARMRDEGVAS